MDGMGKFLYLNRPLSDKEKTKAAQEEERKEREYYLNKTTAIEEGTKNAER